MAFGFPPKHIERQPLSSIDRMHFLAIACDAALALEWKVTYISENGLIAYTKFSNEEITVKLTKEAVEFRSKTNGNGLLDWGKNRKNIAAFTTQINRLKSHSSNEEWEAKQAVLKTHFASVEEDLLLLPPPTTKDKIQDFFSIFVPRIGYFITPLLINLNLLVFIAMVATGMDFLSPSSESLLAWGANFRPLTMEGEWWRLFTCCFIHIGILHLLMNMYALFYIGLLLEPYLGKTKFIFAYLLTGISASMTSLWWHDLTVSAGASGAIFGMYGVFLALLTTHLIERETRQALLSSIGLFVGYNLLIGMKDGIDNAAHIGGLLSGILIGYSFIPSLKNPTKQLLSTTLFVLSLVVVLSACFFAYQKIPRDVSIYSEQLRVFGEQESKALEVYSLPENTPTDTLLDQLQNKGIYYWNKNIALIDSLQKLDLPLHIQERNAKLKTYCEIRAKSFGLMYKEIKENTDIYQQEIEACNRQIDSLLKELNAQQ